jgi:hypothetical protein
MNPRLIPPSFVAMTIRNPSSRQRPMAGPRLLFDPPPIPSPETTTDV